MKIAGVQMDVSLAQPEQNLSRMTSFAAEAASDGAELIIFPECAVPGYCFASLEEALPFGEALSGPSVDRLTATAEQLGVHIVFGFLEEDGGRLFNACACVGPSGLVASYRKVHLPYLGVDRFTTPGDRPFAVHDLGSVRIGMCICYDASFPEGCRVLALAGADLIVLPTNWPPGAEQTAKYVVNARASENKVFFAAINRVGTEGGFRFIGRSKICDDHGNTLAKASDSGETILYSEIDPSAAREKRIQRAPGQHAIDRFADRRPEMYRPLVE